jgi:hypothetical protein
MLSSIFWTQSRFTGVVLILGCLVLGSGLWLYWPIKDEKGAFIFGLPPREWLRLVFNHPRLWRWGTILFISGVVATILGLAMFTSLLRDAGDRTFSLLGLIASAFGAVLWVISLAFRLSIDPWAAQETAKTAAIPEFYVPLTRWTGILFAIYTVLAFSALAAYGAAVLSTHVLPHWVGWLAIIYGLAGLGLVGVTGDADPFFHLVLPVVIGILLLLRGHQVPARSQREEGSTAAPTPSIQI